MSESDYEICKVIKKIKEEYNRDLNASQLARLMHYSAHGMMYHLKKLERLGILERDESKRYRLKVNNLK